MLKFCRILVLSLPAAFVFIPNGFADQPVQLASTDIIGLDFKDLSQIEVTSVSKKEDKLMETAAAVYVITGEEIRRSGVTTLAEALRLAPGIEVSRTNSNTWAISSRGFNGTAANKLLVLIDGRSVYTPLYSGVFWDVQSIQLENVDRIEVIRGPGAAVWGANAVNGVINVIRKPSSETQGGRVIAGGGTEERSFGSVRYGGQLGHAGYYRVWGQYADRDDMRKVGGGDSGDAWHTGKLGFRADWDSADQDFYLFSTDVYSGREGQTSPMNTLTSPYRTVQHDQTLVDGGNVMARWTRKFSSRANVQLQVYYDRTRRHIPNLFTETRNTYDAELQNQFSIGSRQKFIWGGGYRASADEVRDSFGVDFDPDSHTSENYSAFFQDEIRLGRSVLFTLGSKVEHNDYTGAEVEPNARASWMINDQNTLWTSVSRAVRTPTRFDRDLRISAVINPAPLTAVSFRGAPDFESEDLIAYELGYRAKPSSHLFVDVASFYNVYNNLRSIEPGVAFVETSPAPSHVVVPFYFQNQLEAESYGVEISPQAQITEWWRVQAQYSYLHLRLHLKDGSQDTQSIPTEGNDPTHQISLRTAFNLPHHFELDGGVRYVDNLPNLRVRSYAVSDARIGWRGIRNVNIEVIGQNLFETHHLEFQPGNEVERGVFGRVTWDF